MVNQMSSQASGRCSDDMRIVKRRSRRFATNMLRPLKSKEKNMSKEIRPWWHAVFIFSGVSLLVCLMQIFLPPPFGLLMTSSQVADIGISPGGCDQGIDRCICPRETICATNMLSMVLLVLARCSAYFDYPLYMMMFLSKANNMNNLLRRTALREWIDFADMHRVHSIFGVVIGVETVLHSSLHICRWISSGNIYLLWGTKTGVTGLVSMVVTPLIVWPMYLQRSKTHLQFEFRKGLHYLFYFWAISLMWHAPSRIYYLIGVPFLLYVVDFLVGFFLRSHLVENVYFERFGERGVALHFENPKGFDCLKTSYVYLMCPWISKWQWHAFTVFPDPVKKGHSMICIATSGGWTKTMYAMIKSPCLHSVYVAGPFSSEFSDMAVHTSNAIAIASGIGITPTLSLMLSYTGKKRVNVIWICRDPGLVEYFLHKLDVSTLTKYSFAIIFYTGKRELLLPGNLPINLFIFHSRPNLEETISGIIVAIHSGEGLPEEMYESQKALADVPFSERIKIALGRITTIYSKEEMFLFAVEKTSQLAAGNKIDLETGPNKHAPTATLSGGSIADREDQGQSLAQLGASDSYSNFIQLVNGGSNVNEALAGTTDDVVSVDGLESMISSFLGGIGEYSRSDIENLFRLVDADGSGYIDKEEFENYIDLALAAEGKHSDCVSQNVSRRLGKEFGKVTRRLTIESVLSSDELRNNDVGIGDADTILQMEIMAGDKEIGDWSMFYCGASTPIEKKLQSISKKYNMGLGVERFDW